MQIKSSIGWIIKTTTAQNIEAAIGKSTTGYRNVLFINLGEQGSLTKAFGIRIQENQKTSAALYLQKSNLGKQTQAHDLVAQV